MLACSPDTQDFVVLPLDATDTAASILAMDPQRRANALASVPTSERAAAVIAYSTTVLQRVTSTTDMQELSTISNDIVWADPIIAPYPVQIAASTIWRIRRQSSTPPSCLLQLPPKVLFEILHWLRWMLLPPQLQTPTPLLLPDVFHCLHETFAKLMTPASSATELSVSTSTGAVAEQSDTRDRAWSMLDEAINMTMGDNQFTTDEEEEAASLSGSPTACQQLVALSKPTTQQLSLKRSFSSTTRATDVLQCLLKFAAETNQQFSKGAFLVHDADQRLFRWLQPGGYPRLSSHLKQLPAECQAVGASKVV